MVSPIDLLFFGICAALYFYAIVSIVPAAFGFVRKLPPLYFPSFDELKLSGISFPNQIFLALPLGVPTFSSIGFLNLVGGPGLWIDGALWFQGALSVCLSYLVLRVASNIKERILVAMFVVAPSLLLVTLSLLIEVRYRPVLLLLLSAAIGPGLYILGISVRSYRLNQK